MPSPPNTSAVSCSPDLRRSLNRTFDDIEACVAQACRSAENEGRMDRQAHEAYLEAVLQRNKSRLASDLRWVEVGAPQHSAAEMGRPGGDEHGEFVQALAARREKFRQEIEARERRREEVRLARQETIAELRRDQAETSSIEPKAADCRPSSDASSPNRKSMTRKFLKWLGG